MIKTACIVDETGLVLNRIIYDETLPPEKQWQAEEGLSLAFDTEEKTHIGDLYDEEGEVFKRSVVDAQTLEVQLLDIAPAEKVNKK